MRFLIGALGIIFAIGIATSLLCISIGRYDNLIVWGMTMICAGMLIAWTAICCFAAEQVRRNHMRDISFKVDVHHKRLRNVASVSSKELRRFKATHLARLVRP